MMKYMSFYSLEEYVEESEFNLGSGAFGNIRSAVAASTKTPVAVKVAKSEEFVSTIIRELQNLHAVREAGGHENVIELIDCVFNKAHASLSKRDPSLVLTRCDFSLSKWIELAHGHATEPVRVEATRQVYSGLEFIHRIGIIHFDLHCSNILVHGPTGLFKICDFGTSRQTKVFDLVLDRIRDVKAATVAIVIVLWLGHAHMQCSSVIQQRRRHCLSKRICSNLIGKAEHIIQHRPSQIAMKLTDQPLPSWQDEIEQNPDLETVIRTLMSWTFSHPSNPRGIPVPETLHLALTYGNMLGPKELLTAKSILNSVSQAISEQEQLLARDAIHQITADISSTGV